jgi:purine-binding chemotaxis protein CheW
LSGERYALDTVHVIEAITVNHMVPVPLCPPWLIGLTSLRGTPLPVVDLRAVLRLPAGRASRGSSGACQAVVLRVDGILVAGEVDRIEAVYALAGAQLAPGTGTEHPAVKGLLDAGRPDAPATLLDDGELARRVNELRFRAKWEPGPLGD